MIAPSETTTPGQLVAGVRAADKNADAVKQEIGGKRGEASGDQLLRAALGRLAVISRSSEAPDNDARRAELNQRVKPEPQQRHRPGDQRGDDRHAGLDRHPADAQPRQCLRMTYDANTIGAGRERSARELSASGHA